MNKQLKIRFIVTLVLISASLLAWIFGAGISYEGTEDDFADTYDDLADDKKEIKKELRYMLEDKDTDLTAEQVYEMELRYTGYLQDGCVTYYEAAVIMSDLYACYNDDIDLLKMVTEMATGSRSSHDINEESIRVVRIVYFLTLALMISTAAAFVLSVLRMLWGKKKHAPIPYMVLTIIGVLPSAFLAMFMDSPGLTMGISPMAAAAAAAAVAGVVVWHLLTPREDHSGLLPVR